MRTLPFISCNLATAAKTTGLNAAVIREACEHRELTRHYWGPGEDEWVIRAIDLFDWLEAYQAEHPPLLHNSNTHRNRRTDR